MKDDLISRQAALDAIKKLEKPAPTAQHLSAIFDCEDTIKALPPAQPEYERVSAEDVAVSIAPTKLASAVWLYGTLTELEKAGYVICRRMT